MRRLVPLVGVLALFHACLAFGFAWITPWRMPGILYGSHVPDIGAPDEYAHANYVRSLMRGEGLPRLDAGAVAEGSYENHHPPLFYLLDAGVGRVCGVDVDSPSARLPLRGLNALFGAGTVVAAFLLAFWASGRPRLALGVAAFVAVLPMNAALSGAVSNDPLLYHLCTLFAAVGVRHVQRPEWRTALLLGGLAGLAALTKATGLALLPVLPFLVRDRRQLLAAVGLLALLVGPWLVRNEIVYGHPLATNAFNEVFPRTVDSGELRTARGLARWIHVVGAQVAESTVGRFGYMDILLPSSLVYPLVLLIGFGLVCGLRLRSAPSRFRLAAGVLSGVVLLGFLSFNARQYQPQARLLFPLIGLLAYAVAEGYRRRGGTLAYAVLIGGLLVADVCALTVLPSRFLAHADPKGAGSVARQ